MPDQNEKKLSVRSVAFSQGGHIPKKYSCDGEDINPPLEISDIPATARSLALIMEDPDAPRGIFDHWIVWNIPPDTAIAENSNPGLNGTNSFGEQGYGGPCPPSGSHRYYFKVFALDDKLDLPAGGNKSQLEDAMKDHIVATGELMAHYSRNK